MSKQAGLLSEHPLCSKLEHAATLPQPTISAWQTICWIADRSIVKRLPVLNDGQFYFPGDTEGYIASERMLVIELARGELIADAYSAKKTERGLVGSGHLVPIPQQIFKDPSVGIWWFGEVTNRIVRNEVRPVYDGPFFTETQLLTDDVLRLWPPKKAQDIAPDKITSILSSPRRGPRANRREETVRSMRAEIEAGSLSKEELAVMLEKVMAARYRVSRETARKARQIALAETPPNSDK